MDGHEREDVVLDRQTRFLPQMEKILEEMAQEPMDLAMFTLNNYLSIKTYLEIKFLE